MAVRVDAAAATAGDTPLPMVEGMFCRVEIPGRTMTGVYRLPRWAVSFQGDIYLSRDGRLEIKKAEIARSQGTDTFLSGGVAPGELAVVTRLVNPLPNALLEYDAASIPSSRLSDNLAPAGEETAQVARRRPHSEGPADILRKEPGLCQHLPRHCDSVGVLCRIRLVRETFPEFTLDMITVSVPWPGADPEEVEEGICRKLEEAVKGIPGIRSLTRWPRKSRGVLTVEVRGKLSGGRGEGPGSRTRWTPSPPSRRTRSAPSPRR